MTRRRVNISVIDKAELVHRLWDYARTSDPSVQPSTEWYDPTPPSRQECTELAKEWISWRGGVRLCVDVSGNTADPRQYNCQTRTHGAFQRIVRSLARRSPRLREKHGIY